jgi:hypothetical protein
MKEIIEQLNSLQIGDLVWWSDQGVTVIGIVTELDVGTAGYLWRADFPQDGEHCFWDEYEMEEYVEEGMLGVVWKSEI